MAVKKSQSTKETVYNPKFLAVTPYVGNAPGSNTWLLQDVVRDSVSISQDDAETNTVENEFSSSPIIQNVIVGAHNFAANVGDLQNDLLHDLLGYSVDAVSGKAYAPAGYQEVFAKVELVFQNGTKEVSSDGTTTVVPKYWAVVLPKVQLNAAVTIESLNSSVGTIAIAGVAQDTEVTDSATSEGGSEEPRKYVCSQYVDPDFDASAYTD